jgi:hypothetical protein
MKKTVITAITVTYKPRSTESYSKLDHDRTVGSPVGSPVGHLTTLSDKYKTQCVICHTIYDKPTTGQKALHGKGKLICPKCRPRYEHLAKTFHDFLCLTKNYTVFTTNLRKLAKKSYMEWIIEMGMKDPDQLIGAAFSWGSATRPHNIAVGPHPTLWTYWSVLDFRWQGYWKTHKKI